MNYTLSHRSRQGKCSFGVILVIAAVIGVGYWLTHRTPSVQDQLHSLATATDDDARKSAADGLADRLDPAVAEQAAQTIASNPSDQPALVEMTNEYKTFLQGQDPPQIDRTAHDVGDRISAATCLGKLNCDQSADLLQDTALNDPESKVRVVAVNSLTHIDSSKRLPDLIGLLKSDNHDVRQGVKDALVQEGKNAVAPLLAAKEADNSLPVADVLAQIGQPAVQALMDKLGSADWVADTLGQIGQPAYDSLMDRIHSDSQDARFAAGDAMAKMAKYHPDVVSDLIDAMRNGNLDAVARNYVFYIRLGREGTEAMLNDALNAHGDVTMATDYLNCANQQLEDGATSWAHNHGYEINSTFGAHGGPVWGQGT